MKSTTRKPTHGGARRGAGRKSAFPGKASAQTVYVDMTPAGRQALAAIQKRRRLSRVDVIEALARAHANDVNFENVDGRSAFPGKLGEKVFALRLTPVAHFLITAAATRTGHSVSDVVEALVDWFGKETTYPKAVGAQAFCRTHPRYRAIRRPSVDCAECRVLYRDRNGHA